LPARLLPLLPLLLLLPRRRLAAMGQTAAGRSRTSSSRTGLRLRMPRHQALLLLLLLLLLVVVVVVVVVVVLAVTSRVALPVV
jgi:hypothetical protein